jgi:hypothetical protein
VLTGTAQLDELAAGAPVIESFDAQPVRFERVEVLQALFEQPYDTREANLPPGLHPTTPPLLILLAWAVEDSPWGPFSLAQARVSCRSGVRPRGFVRSCIVDNPDAGAALASTWGLPVKPGRVRLSRHYDGLELAVEREGTVAASFSGLDPDPLDPGDVQYTVTTTLARTPRGLRLVQVEPDYEPDRVERLAPRLNTFDTRAWGATGLRPVYPVSASIAVGALTIPKVRFLSRPDVPAFEGTEKI